MRALAALVPLLLVASPRMTDAKCARMGMAPIVLTADVVVPAGGDGGIVIGTEQLGWDRKDLGQAEDTTWGFLTNLDLEQAKVTKLAPGLVVVAPRAAGKGTRELGGGSVKATLRWGTDKVAPLAAPEVTSITHKRELGRRGGFNGRTVVTLAGDPPAGAVALVLADGKGKARSYGVPEGREVVVFQTRACAPMPDGTIESKVGDKVVVRWVDKHGRLSSPSAPFTVAAAR